jgi:tetratricopeptide (TPR) repeat protein
MKTVKIFLASSNELLAERRQFKIDIATKNALWRNRGVYLDLHIWEDLPARMMAGGSQSGYNKYVRESDLFVLLAYSKVGIYTDEEFETAFGAFKDTQKPFIFTYFKSTDGIATEPNLDVFKQKLKDLKHFYCPFTDSNDLWNQFNKELDRLAEAQFATFKHESNGGGVKNSLIHSSATVGHNLFQGDGNTINIITNPSANPSVGVTSSHPVTVNAPILRGRIVTKAAPNNPLRGVVIEIVGTKDNAHTDENGFFNITCSGKVYGDDISLILYHENYRVMDERVLREIAIRKNPDWVLELQMEAVAQYNADLAKSTNDIIANQQQVAAEQTQVLLTKLAELQAAQQSNANDTQVQALKQQIYQIEAERDNAIGQARDIAAKLLVFDPEHASEDAKRAHALFLDGKLPEAYAALDEAKMQERAKAAQNILQQAISDYMQKGQLAIANGKFDAAERFYTEGSRLDDTNVENLWTLANFLYHQNNTLKAITYYERALSLSKTDELIGTFSNSLGAAYSAVNKMPEAEKYYLQSLGIYTQLAQSNLQRFEPYLAGIAMNLGNYYSDVNKMPEAGKYFLQSLEIRTRLSKSNPQQFEPDLAKIAMNLGNYYSDVNKMPKAETYYLQALDIYMRLSKSNPQQFDLYLATTAMNLGNYYQTVNKMPEAERYYLQSLDIRTRLSESNPQQFEPDLAFILNNYGYFHFVNKQYDKAQDLLSRGLALRQKALLNGQLYYSKECNRVFNNLGKVATAFNEQKAYAKAVDVQTERAKSTDALKAVIENGHTAAAEAYGQLSWCQLLTQDYADAAQSAQRGIALDAAQTWIQTNLAHALLCQHQDAAAKKVYDSLKNASNTEGSSFRTVLMEDFETLAEAGLDAKQLDKARAWVRE